MEQSELLHFVVEALERIGLRYFVTGSMATIFFGEPRFTNDIDIVVDLPSTRSPSLCAAFQVAAAEAPGTYLSEAPPILRPSFGMPALHFLAAFLAAWLFVCRITCVDPLIAIKGE
jgi:hypothetical protein